MNNPHMLSADGRLKSWRTFRDSLTGLDFNQKLLEVSKYWSTAPQAVHYLDDADPKSWPTPWELINEGLYCRSTIGLLMKYTLELDHELQNCDFKLKLIKDLSRSEMYLILVVNNEYVLNYDHATVNLWKDIEHDCQVLCDF